MISKLALFSLVGCLSIATPSLGRRIDATHPNLPLACDPNPYAGELMLVSMPFGGAAPTGGVVLVASLTPGNFDFLPSAVSYNPGDTTVSFYVQVDPNATGFIQLTVASDFGVGSVIEGVRIPSSSLLTSARF